jgi:hypothetical protein
MSISLPLNILEGASNSDKFTTFATKRIEPIFDGATHYANKVIFSIQGEFLPGGKEQTNLMNSPQPINIANFLNGFTTLVSQNCTLTSVNINESNSLGVVPYEVDCECYAFNDQNRNKTISAKNEISVTQNLDGTISIGRNINVSAVSINGSNPVDDAKTFAYLLSGQTTNWKLNASNKSSSFPSIVLNSSSETADISNGSYSIQQNFTANSLKQYISRNVLIKNSIETQSGIDGLASFNIKTTAIGGLLNTEEQIRSALTSNIYRPPGVFNVISNTASYDNINKTAEVNTVYSNDLSITKNGNKVNNSLSFNFDFFTKNYTANFNSEVRPTTIVKADSSALKGDLSKIKPTDIALFSPLKKAAFISDSSSEGTGIGAQTAIASQSFISSPSVQGNTQGITLYDLSLNVEYQAGYPQNSFTPLLSGKGKYYQEDLDYVNNSVISTTINGKYKDIVPTKTIFDPAIKSGEIAQLSKKLLLKDELSIDYNNRSFNYTNQMVGNDSTFKDLK